MKNKLLTLFVILVGLISFNWHSPSVQAATTIQNPSKVLVVYDSLNERNHRQEDVQTLSRMLMSMGQQVTMMSMSDYHAGMILKGHYQAVITMINWPGMKFDNPAFDRDRQQFNGKKLHIGPLMTADEKQNFPGNWQEINQQSFILKGQNNRYEQQVDFQRQIQLLDQVTGNEQALSQLVAANGTNQTYPFGIINGQNAYLPFFSSQGATLLSSIQLIAQWLGVHGNYVPYVDVRDFTPLSSFTATKEFIKNLDSFEGNMIITTTSTTQNTDTKTFKNYLKFLREMTRNNRAVVYLNVPALNGVDSSNDDTLMNMLTQEISTLIENKIFPLGISAPTYWNFDKYYQLNALNFGDATLLYNQVNSQDYHTQTSTAKAYQTMFFAIPHSALKNIKWNINGRYTDFTFPMPVTVDYHFPNSKAKAEKINREIKALPFAPENQYLYQFNTGISTQTQNLRGENGVISLNETPVSEIDFHQIKQQTAGIQKNQDQTGHLTTKGIVDKINNVLIVIIVVTLIVLLGMLAIGRKLYLRMFKNRNLKRTKGAKKK